MEPDHLKTSGVLEETGEILESWQLGLSLTYLATGSTFRKYRMNHICGSSCEINQVLVEEI